MIALFINVIERTKPAYRRQAISQDEDNLQH